MRERVHFRQSDCGPACGEGDGCAVRGGRIRHRRERGFTLLELLVAVALLALVSVLGYRGLDGMIRARNQLGEHNDRFRALGQTWEWLQRDLGHLMPDVPSTVGTPRWGSSLDGNGNAVLLFTTAVTPPAPNGDAVPQLRSVVYRLNGGQLWREERPHRSGNEGATALRADDPGSSTLLAVDEWRWRVWVPNQGWLALENPAARGQVWPQALHVTLRIGSQTFTRTFVTQP